MQKKEQGNNSIAYYYDVALSFAGEDRNFVEKVAQELIKMDIKVFYDKYEEVILWGKNLYTHLRDIYQTKARYTVMFISKNYAQKVWTNHERESAQARAFIENKEYILPVRFDNTKIPGELPTIGYISLKGKTPRMLAELIKEKIGPIPRINYFPDNPDRLFEELKVREPKKQELIYNLAYTFHESFKLMTPTERDILFKAYLETCPEGPPENIHLNLQYFLRILSMEKQELIAIFSRLDCLGFRTKINKVNEKKDRHKICGDSEIITITYEINKPAFSGNASFIMISIFDIMTDLICKDCLRITLENADFSILSTAVGYKEKK